MKLLLVIVMSGLFNTLFAQQRVVQNSHLKVFQIDLIENNFDGKIQSISRFLNKFYTNQEFDTVTYCSNQNGVFIDRDTAGFNLAGLFEDITLILI